MINAKHAGSLLAIVMTVLLVLGMGGAEYVSAAPVAANQSPVKLQGVVLDETGAPVPGAAIFVKGTTTGSISELDGSFVIQVPAGSVLTISCIGYADVELPAQDGMKIILSEDKMLLDEVVVVGYGQQRKELMTSSVVQVNSKDLQKAPQTNVSNMLTGKLAGVTSVQSTGQPGADDADITIRGLSTYGSNNRPLYIIDGMESESMNSLNPSDIESISVLKDAAAASVYGVRGGNGVILITTKSGSKSDHATISYDGSFTITSNVGEPELLNAEEYIYWYNKTLTQDGKAPMWTDEVINKMKEQGIYGDTNWRDLIYNKVGTMHQHNVSVNGGNDKISYFGSVGYMDQRGTLKNFNFNRLNARASVNAQILPGLRFNANLSMRRSLRSQPAYDMGNQEYFSPIQRANYMIPIIKPEYNGLPLGMYNSGAVLSPNNEIENSGYQKYQTWEWQARSSLEYKFSDDTVLKGLKLSFFAGVNFIMESAQQFAQRTELYAFDRNTFTVSKTVSEGISIHNFNKSNTWSSRVTLRPQINYDRTFGQHTVSFTGLFERTKYFTDFLKGYKEAYAATSPVDIDLGTKQHTPYVEGNHNTTGNAGFVVRLGYNYAEKYLVELSAREEASYVFPPEGRWGFFPSVSLGWIASKEEFLKKATWLDNLKIRASVGQLGSSDVEPYLFLSSYQNSTSMTWVLGGTTPVYGFYTKNPYVYRDLTWSHTTAYNVGADMTVLRGRLTVGLDVFYKYTDRILEASGGNNYSPSLGGENPTWQNTGTMDDKGFELTIRHDNWLPSGFNYSISANLAFSRNKVLSRYISDSYSVNNIQIGRSLGQWYGFKTDGYYMTQEEVDAAPAPPSGYAEIGALKYVDINGDGKISRDSRDYVWLGYSRLPEMNGSLNIELSYKGFGLSALFYGVTLTNYPIVGVHSSGHSDGTLFSCGWYGAGGNAFKHVLENAFDPTAENLSAEASKRYPRIHVGHNSNNDVLSDWWMIDGSYIRLKSVQLSYTLPEKITRKIRMANAMIYLAGTNLFTISHYPYLDPENPGITNGYYPQQRTFSLGLNLTF